MMRRLQSLRARLAARWLRPAPLALDFAQAQAQSRGPGLALLAAAAALLTLVLWQSERQEQRANALEAQLAQLAPGQPSRSAAQERPASAEELQDRMQRANRVIAQFNTPWEDVFGGIERASGEHVALLSMESDPGSAQVRVGAEARNFKAMLHYLDALRKDGRLAPAILQSHQLMVEDPNKPVRFTFTASWTSAKKAPR